MGLITISVPEELERSMNEFSLNWSEVVKKVLIEKTEKLKKLKAFSSKIKLSDKDAKELANKIDSAVADKFLKEE